MADILLHYSMHFENHATGETSRQKLDRLRDTFNLVIYRNKGLVCRMKQFTKPTNNGE